MYPTKYGLPQLPPSFTTRRSQALAGLRQDRRLTGFLFRVSQSPSLPMLAQRHSGAKRVVMSGSTTTSKAPRRLAGSHLEVLSMG
ncbi:hypothetical protein BDZ89DRAFT_809830 [Hymenopellis radicata]|nr:hypothetical protein BDZ89DRAFT_809830 [Hymenopellis radicata]